MEHPITKQEKRELRRQHKEKERMQRTNQRRNKKITRWVIVILIVIVAVWIVTQLGSSPQRIGSGEPHEVFPDDWVKGNLDGAVVLMEYSDFQCPACASYFPLVKQLHDDFPSNLLIVYRHFPLRSVHTNAQLAAQAAEAAGKQGKFWEMHDILFENQNEWSSAGFGVKDAFVSYAESLGLDVTKFTIDIDDKAIRNRVNRDVSFGNRLSVNSTPSFFLNGQKIQNPRSYEQFKALIEAAISDAPLTQDISQEHDESDVHIHADFSVYLDGAPVDFTQEKYQSTESHHLHPNLHLHDGKGNILHRHADGVTLADFFESLGMKFTKECFTLDKGISYCAVGGKDVRMYVNGKPNEAMEEYVVNDLDQILITFGEQNSKTLQDHLESVTDEACIYSKLCPERGTPPEESCVKGLGGGCK